MSSSSSTARVKHQHSEPPKPSVSISLTGSTKIITACLGLITLALASFALISLTDPAWLKQISSKGVFVEARDYTDYGDVFMRKGNIRAALSQYQKALQINPDFAYARINMAVAYGRLGETTKAITMLQEALRLPSKQVGVAYFNLGDLYDKTADPQEAEECYRNALKKGVRPDVIHQRLGTIAFKAGQFHEAQTEFEAELEERTDITSSYREMLRNAITTQEYDTTNLPVLERLISQPIEMADIARYDTTLLRSLQQSDQEISRAQHNLGATCAQLGLIDSAAQHLQAAIRIWPDNISAKENMANLRRLQSDQETFARR